MLKRENYEKERKRSTFGRRKKKFNVKERKLKFFSPSRKVRLILQHSSKVTHSILTQLTQTHFQSNFPQESRSFETIFSIKYYITIK